MAREPAARSLSSRFDPVEDRHRDIDHQQVGIETRDLFDEHLPVANRHNVELWLEKTSGRSEECLVVVGQQYASGTSPSPSQQNGDPLVHPHPLEAPVCRALATNIAFTKR